jgi:hypothetical protein
MVWRAEVQIQRFISDSAASELCRLKANLSETSGRSKGRWTTERHRQSEVVCGVSLPESHCSRSSGSSRVSAGYVNHLKRSKQSESQRGSKYALPQREKSGQAIKEH